jgi:hypothetical protein
MNVYQWLSEYILLIAAIYNLALIIIFCIFAVRIGHIKTIDDLLPEEARRQSGTIYRGKRTTVS